jgi:hypothetical protein
MRIELAFEPHFARQIGIGQIDNDRAPDAEVDRPACLLRHRLNHRHRQTECIAAGERPVDIDEWGAQAGRQPNSLSIIAGHQGRPLVLK